MTADLDAAVRTYFAGNAEREHARLHRDDCAIELALTTRMLAAHLPAGGRVLDLGGGSGRYARWLAESGFRVTLADPSPELLAIAREHLAGAAAVEEIAEADARDLSRWDDAAFDAVVALGPFYHLTEADGRRRAAREMARVLRPGGIACAAVIPRYALLRGVIATPAFRHRLHDPAFAAEILERGVFVNDQPGRFTGAYGVEPGDAADVLPPPHWETVAIHAQEGFASDLQGAVAALEADAPEGHAALIDVLHARSTDLSLFGTAGHLVVVARRTDHPLA